MSLRAEKSGTLNHPQEHMLHQAQPHRMQHAQRAPRRLCSGGAIASSGTCANSWRSLILSTRSIEASRRNWPDRSSSTSRSASAKQGLASDVSVPR